MEHGTPRVLSFDEAIGLSNMVLGGKGAGLVEMTKIGLPVPPGIIITTQASRKFFEIGGKLPPRLDNEIREKLKIIENKTGRMFGDPSNPLLLSARSGAPLSMPGMMDTILNVGLNDETVEGLASITSNKRFAYDSYRRLIQMFGKVVLGVGFEKFETVLNEQKKKHGVKLDLDLSEDSLLEIISSYKNLIRTDAGRVFPQEPFEQLFLAVEAVFKSWRSPRAIVYRKAYGISEEIGTGVNIQAMVFGNRGDSSCTGVAFTRSPSTGEKKLYGEYLRNAQGEDVVAGIRTPKSIQELQNEDKHCYQQLVSISKTLEAHYKEVQDFEFTVEEGKLFMLQTRAGKRTAQAAVKITVDMVHEGLIDKAEAIRRVEPDQIGHLLHRHVDPSAKVKSIAKGLPASPGAAIGKVVFNVDEAEELGKKGEAVILVRTETAPEDIHGVIPSKGILTSRGGMTSHAAVVARGMGKPAVVGCEEITIDIENEKFTAGNTIVQKGDVITVDGGTGRVILGEVPLVEPELGGELSELLKWADDLRTMRVRANADTPAAASKARLFGAEGIGLCRTERMFNAQDRLPIVQEMIMSSTDEDRKKALEKLLPMQKDDFKQIFKAMDGLPVTIRLLDLPLHEFLPRLEDLLTEVAELKLSKAYQTSLAQKEKTLRKVMELREHNPMLGHRGCRLAIRHPEIYEMQARAIGEAAAELTKQGVEVKLEIMIPLVSVADELAFLREKVSKTIDEVFSREDVKIDYEVGTMIETPRAALTAEEVAKHADFFSFGTNDLTQTTFGFSRDDAETKFMANYLENGILKANPFEELDRAGIGKLIKLAVAAGRSTKPNLKIGICGEHGGEPSSIEFCHSVGLNYVSCSPFRVPIARLTAARAEVIGSR